jgi:hypothetical protein
LIALAALFFITTIVKVLKERRLTSQGRTWLLVAAIFGGVSVWLWFR